MIGTLIDRDAAWLSGDGPDADIVLHSQCRLLRNLADYPFPGQCKTDVLHLIEERLLNAFDGVSVLADCKYWRLDDLDSLESRFLAECGLVSPALVESDGPRGAFVSEDQTLSLVVNGENHLSIQVVGTGQQLQDVWSRANAIDDALAPSLDFAVNERLGYLTTSVGDVGTGLRAEVVMHLPALDTHGKIPELEAEVKRNHHRLEPLFGSKQDALGDLYRLSNQSTLGRSEEEIIFQLRHFASDIVGRERESRRRMESYAPVQLEDRVWRAVGVVRRARLLTFGESLKALSSLRLGVAEGVLNEYNIGQINETMLASQNAHLEMRRGQGCDELTLNTERAEHFRARFS